MDLFSYNDNELLYLISHKHDDAMEIMHRKYDILIKSMINKYQFRFMMNDDLILMGHSLLEKAIRNYNIYSKKSFNKYFTMVYNSYLIDCLRKENRQLIQEYNNEYVESIDEELYEDQTISDYEVELSEFEEKVLKMYAIGNLSVNEIAEKLNKDQISISNCLQRVKKKFKKCR